MIIKKLLKDLSVSFWGNEENQRLYRQYHELTKEDGWGVHQSLMVNIANGLSKYMLSEAFTKMDATEKDTHQRAFFIAKEIIEFLLSPLKGAEKHAAIERHNKKMEATIRKQPKEPGRN